MASNKVMVNIKMEPAVKLKAQKIAKDIGIPLGTLINIQLRQFIRDKGVAVSTGYTMTPYLEKILEQVERDKKTGKNFSPVFSDIDSAIAYLKGRSSKTKV